VRNCRCIPIYYANFARALASDPDCGRWRQGDSGGDHPVQQKEAGRSQVAVRATTANEAIENFFMFYPFKDLQGGGARTAVSHSGGGQKLLDCRQVWGFWVITNQLNFSAFFTVFYSFFTLNWL